MEKNWYNKFKLAFTLSEVLLAVFIVGVLAALVMPMVAQNFSNNLFEQSLERYKKQVAQAVDTLAITENKPFFQTMMYTTEEPEDYETTSGAFLKKYMKISQYCGSNNGDCFATTYYQYEDRVKKVYSPEYKGACAILKSGASICIKPQIGGNKIGGIIDVNGKKGPNVFGRDLRTFDIPLKTWSSLDRTTDTVITMENEGIARPDPCDTNPNGSACCRTKPDEIVYGSECCLNSDIYEEFPACSSSCSRGVAVSDVGCAAKPTSSGCDEGGHFADEVELYNICIAQKANPDLGFTNCRYASSTIKNEMQIGGQYVPGQYRTYVNFCSDYCSFLQVSEGTESSWGGICVYEH